MNDKFIDRIVFERDYRISLLHETLELGHLDKNNLFLSLNEITTLEFRILGHFKIMNISKEPILKNRLSSVMQSCHILEKALYFTDGVVATLSSDSINRHLLIPYYDSNDEISVREKIMVNGQNKIFESFGLHLSDL